ncbi:MAG: hypothetical protein HY293_17130 [Planctomycetes bacterium]|nr:hypothetical protein [Planctomycetota bacterium]
MDKTWVILAGLAHFGLVALGSQVPRAFRWREDLARLGAANRRLFWVYGIFIVLSNIGFGALSLAYAGEIASGTGAAGGLALFLGLYWVARLITQYAAFNTPDWPEEGKHPVAKHGMGLLFLAMSAVYLAAFVHGRRV